MLGLEDPPEDLRDTSLKGKEFVSSLDLSGEDLSGVDFSNVRLEDAQFQFADLQGLIFRVLSSLTVTSDLQI